MSQTFSPSKLLESLHSLPRFGYGNQIINKDAPLSDWRYYLRGIGINSGIYAVVGTVAFIAVILTYSAACCCRPMACCNRLYAFKDAAKRLRRRVYAALLLCFVVLVAFSAASAGQIANISKAATNGATVMQQGAWGMQYVNSYLNGVTAQMQAVSDYASQLQEYPDYSNGSPYSTLSNMISAMSTYYDDSFVPPGYYTSIFNNVFQYNSLAKHMSSLYMFWPVIWTFLTAVCLLPFKPCKILFRILVVTGMILWWFSWIINAGIFGVSVLGADACYDPEVSLQNFFGCDACVYYSDSFECNACYYATCDTVPMFISSLPDVADNANSNAQSALQDFYNLPSPSLSSQYTYASLKTSLGFLTSSAYSFQNIASCFPPQTPGSNDNNNFNQLWHQGRDIACTTVANGGAHIFIFHAVSLCVMFLLLLALTPLWNNHPSEKEASSEEVTFLTTSLLQPTAPLSPSQEVSLPITGNSYFPMMSEEPIVTYGGPMFQTLAPAPSIQYRAPYPPQVEYSSFAGRVDTTIYPSPVGVYTPLSQQ